MSNEPNETMIEAGWLKATEMGATGLEGLQDQKAMFILGFRLGWRYHWATATNAISDESHRLKEPDSRVITVCGACLQASCWQGIFYCQDYKMAGMRKITVRELRKISKEHPSYWKTDEELAHT